MKEMQKTKPVKIKSAVIELAQRSSLHGFPSLSNESGFSIVKTIWIVCCAFSWGFLIYQIISLVNSYLDFKTISTVSVGFEVPSHFPGTFI